MKEKRYVVILSLRTARGSSWSVYDNLKQHVMPETTSRDKQQVTERARQLNNE